MDRKTQSTDDRQGCGVVRSDIPDHLRAGSSVSVSTMTWQEGYTTYDMKRSMYIKHMQYRNIKLIVHYSRVYDDMAVEEVYLPGGQNITWLLKDKVIERIEKALQ